MALEGRRPTLPATGAVPQRDSLAVCWSRKTKRLPTEASRLCSLKELSLCAPLSQPAYFCSQSDLHWASFGPDSWPAWANWKAAIGAHTASGRFGFDLNQHYVEATN